MLMPSFSSKGFGVAADGTAEVANIYKVASEYLTETSLISAYDIHHGNLSQPENALTDLVFVDSGGYETSDLQDLSEVFVQRVERREWDENMLMGVLDNWAADVPAAFVSFDSTSRRVSIAEQAADAAVLFHRYGTQLSVFLIKPETRDQRYIPVTTICGQIDRLSSFDVIGLTEKELGNSMLARMEAIAKIRLSLDDSQNNAPIHVFGSLDPVSIALYFVAGAEIFDGLSWLRYGFHDGVAIYRQDFGARYVGIQERDDFVRAKVMQSNLSYLSSMRIQMRKFLLDANFSRFGPNADLVRESYDALRTKIRGLN
jgi:hypothetical protein